jgi:hypothetical protein
MADEGKRAHM